MTRRFSLFALLVLALAGALPLLTRPLPARA